MLHHRFAFSVDPKNTSFQSQHHTRLRVMSCILAMLLTACSNPPAPYGPVQGESFGVQEVWQSDSNRIVALAMHENLDSLWRLADKLYQRNPVEWRKTADTRMKAVVQIRNAVLRRQAWQPLKGKRDAEALSLALSAGFQGDRVAAFIYAVADTIVAAHGNKVHFTLLDSIQPQHVYNAARNMEIANWILNSRRNEEGKPLLLSNQLDGDGHNLSFEREIGKIIGRLDLVANFGTEKFRRSVIGYGQGMIAGPFLQFLPVR